MSRKLKESSIIDFSQRVTEMARLPNGTELRFLRKCDGRRIRSDFVVKGWHITASTLPVPDDKDTVSTFLENARALLSTDLKARGIELSLVGPNSEALFGNTHIGNVRKIPGRPSSGEQGATVELFGMLVENADIAEDLSLQQLGALFREFRDMLGQDFVRALEKSAARIRAKSQGSSGKLRC